jgi:Fe-S-cluster-containing hydrogenase component 2/CRP-like cAMP-binding protein
MNPPAKLERREGDIKIEMDRYLGFSLFARLKKKPAVEKFPGTLALRHFMRGEVICHQGESGWTAFYLLTAEDMLTLRREQLEAAAGEDEQRLLRAEITRLEQRLQALNGAGKPQPVATAHLASARPSHEKRGLLGRLTTALLKRPTQPAERKPLYIPIDAPADVPYDSRQAALYEGDLFGEQSCQYGTPRSTTVVADRDCHVLEMLRNILDQVEADEAYKAEMDRVYKQGILKDHLRNLSLFSDLTDEQFALIRDKVDLKRHKDGQLIYDEHEASDSMYVIRSGLVKIMKNVSSLLVLEDVLDWGELAAFVRGKDAQAPPAVQHLRQLLPEGVRSATSDPATLPEPEQGELIAALNELIKTAKLAEAAPLKALTSPALVELSQQLSPKPPDWSELDRRRYNRLLLEAACPGALRPRHRPSGPDTVLAYLARGDVVGEMGLLTGQPRGATCIAYVHPRPEQAGAAAEKWRRDTEHVELVSIPVRAFQELLETAPALSKKMEQVIALRTEQGQQRVSVPTWDESAAMLLSGRAEELGLIQGQKLMLIDLDRCTRCDECVQACVNTHTDGRSRLFLDGPRFGKYLVPTTCRACLDPVCMIGCPVGSIHRGDNRQIVIEDWCIGCELCARNCPYGSIQMHDVGIIPGSAYGWSYVPEALAGKGWQRSRHSTAHWLTGKTPFLNNRSFSDSLKGLGGGDGAEVPLCFRYEVWLDADVLRTALRLKMEVVSADEQAAVWVNGQELPRSADRPRGGKREYSLPRDQGLLRPGRNVVAVRVVLRPSTDRKLPVLELRLDEVHQPAAPRNLPKDVEISQKGVTDVAVACDMCSSQLGQRPACVTACPHDAAMRVDARFHFPIH